MSLLTHAVLYASSAGRRFDAAVLAPVMDDGQSFGKLDTDAAGGHKVFCDAVYAACFNYGREEEIRAFVGALPWGYRSGVLIITSEHDERLTVSHHGEQPAAPGWRR